MLKMSIVISSDNQPPSAEKVEENDTNTSSKVNK